MARFEKNEQFAHEWTALRSLWNRTKQNRPDLSSTNIAEVDQLFEGLPRWTSGPEGWNAFNAAEMAVGERLDPINLAVEYRNLLDIAERRGLPSLSRYKQELDGIDNGGRQIDLKRATYLSLLYNLQSGFVEERFTRKLRGETARRLCWFGASALLLTLFVPAIFLLQYMPLVFDKASDGGVARWLFSAEPMFGLTLTATFGIMGAYFSRATDFRSKLETIGFREVMLLYRTPMLILRLLYGMFAAIILYYLIRSELIKGIVFPDISKLYIDNLGVYSGEKGIRRDALSGLTIMAPTVDMAKLMIWGFIAGFSERLVPDALDAAAMKLTITPPQPPSTPSTPLPNIEK